MLVGQKVGPFQIEKEVGSGAMGQVYLARYIKNGQKVAIKIMAPGTTSSNAQARFQREAEVLKQLNHPNIVRFYAASEYHGAPYYAMEFIEGESLDHLLGRRGQLPWEEVVEIGKQVCSALQHAHEQGIIHRDLKPSNLMLLKDGTVKLTDFGIAKDLDVTQLTATNNTVGTASYMSPEQCRGERNLTHKSDLYSLGIMLYELLVGAKPFQAETTMDMFLAHVQGTFERPSRRRLDIPVWLDNLVCQLLEKKPEQRPLDASIVAQALYQVAEKVQAQSSAGVDAARARAGNIVSSKVSVDTEDRKAARSLLGAMRRRRRGRRTKKRFYEGKAIQAVGLLLLLSGVAFLIYRAFQPPDADVLFRQAQKAMDASEFDVKLRARKDGPIAEYLRHYSNSGTEQAGQVQRWADEIDVEQLEMSLPKRKRIGMEPDNDAEKHARRAMELEDLGELKIADERWQEVEKQNERNLALLARTHRAEIAAADEHEVRLKSKLQEARNLLDPFVPAPGPEALAAAAISFEYFGDPGRARARWIELLVAQGEEKKKAKSWVLLARRKQRELKDKVPPGPEELTKRLEMLDLKQAELPQLLKDRPRAAAFLCQEILGLYGEDPDPDVKQKLVPFQTTQAKLGGGDR